MENRGYQLIPRITPCGSNFFPSGQYLFCGCSAAVNRRELALLSDYAGFLEAQNGSLFRTLLRTNGLPCLLDSI